MKRMIKFNLSILVILAVFFVWPESIPVIKVGASDELIVRDLAIDDIILKVEMYLSEYSKKNLANNPATEKLDPKEYLTNKLETDGFTKDEIIKGFEVIAKNRQEELLNLIAMYLEEEPLLSRNTLISKLKENGYSQKEIEYGIKSIDIDWKEQAVKASEKYINTEIEFEDELYLIISRKSLLYFLVTEKDFTPEEASSGIDGAVIDWRKQAFKQAEYYLAADAYSKKGLIEELIVDEFAKEDAEYGVARTQTNWKEQAVSKAESYFDESLFQSKNDFIDYLKRVGFTEEETAYAVNRIFKDEFEVDELSINVLERQLIVKPLESIASHLVKSAQASTNQRWESEDPSLEKPSSNIVKKNESSNKEPSRVAETKEVEDSQELEESLFDSPIFMPVILVLVVGNLYLFQKM